MSNITITSPVLSRQPAAHLPVYLDASCAFASDTHKHVSLRNSPLAPRGPKQDYSHCINCPHKLRGKFLFIHLQSVYREKTPVRKGGASTLLKNGP
mgnify:CR=1 FL=1